MLNVPINPGPNFNQVLDEGLKEMSFFRGTWAVSKDNRQWARQQVTLEGPLWIGDSGRRVKKLALEFNLPEDASLNLAPESPTLVCWLIGKIVRRTYTEDEEGGVLTLHFRTLAILADAAIPRREPGTTRVEESGTVQTPGVGV